DDATTSVYFPLYYLYNYSYSQTIYTAEELQFQGATAGTISKISYKPTASVSTSNWKDWVVYIGQTDQEEFEGTSDWIAVDDLEEVFDGQISDNTTAGEWLEIALDTDFEWDGESNIVVAVDQNTSDWGNTPAWAGYELGSNKGIYYYSDGTNPDPEDPPTADAVSTAVAQIRFEGDLLEDCEGTPSAGTIAENELDVCA